MYYYQHHIGDFIKDTSRLTDTQSMAYLRLMWLYYEQEKPLENDTAVLAFKIGTDVQTIELLLKSYFKLDANEWHQTRCDLLLDAYHKQSEGGKKGAAVRWGNGKVKDTDSLPIATPMPPLIATKNQEPITNNHKPITNINTPSGVCTELWADYMALRKSKKSPMTATALKGLERECNKAGLSLEAGIRVCCERGWASLKAEWLDDKKLTVHQQQMQAFARGIGLGRSEPEQFYQHETLQTVNDIPQLEDHDHEQF